MMNPSNDESSWWIIHKTSLKNILHIKIDNIRFYKINLLLKKINTYKKVNIFHYIVKHKI